MPVVKLEFTKLSMLKFLIFANLWTSDNELLELK